MFENNDYIRLVHQSFLLEENRENSRSLLESTDVKNAIVSFIVQSDLTGSSTTFILDLDQLKVHYT